MNRQPFEFPRVGPRLKLAIALAPALAAVWSLPWFVTQDGPAHLYNGHILNAALRGNSPFESAFTVRARPLPNWAGHLAAMTADALLPPMTGERMLTTLTLVAVAFATLSLRRRVSGLEDSRAEWSAAVFSALVGLNLTWLLGFTSFLLGAALFGLTLGTWWESRNEAGRAPVLRLAFLLVLGYFCHPISLGLTILSLGLLALFATERPRAALLRLAVSGIALVPLGLYYASLTREGGGARPVWESLGNPFSLAGWRNQLGWVDPITFAGKSFRPFSTAASGLNAPFGPTLWLIAGIGLLAAGGRSESKVWLRLGLLLIVAGILSPDTLGASHGHYMPQRLVLLGLAALLPALRLSGPSRATRAGGVALTFALALQTAWVWDYGLESSRKVSSLLSVKPAIGTGQRVGTVLADARNRFRVNPMLHADCFLGIDTGNIVWTNYETNHYYFPVRLRDPEHSPGALAFENISKMASPDRDADRAALWAELIDRHRTDLDVVVGWGHDPLIEKLNAVHFPILVSTSDEKTRVRRPSTPYGPYRWKLDLSRR